MYWSNEIVFFDYYNGFDKAFWMSLKVNPDNVLKKEFVDLGWL